MCKRVIETRCPYTPEICKILMLMNIIYSYNLIIDQFKYESRVPKLVGYNQKIKGLIVNLLLNTFLKLVGSRIVTMRNKTPILINID